MASCLVGISAISTDYLLLELGHYVTRTLPMRTNFFNDDMNTSCEAFDLSVGQKGTTKTGKACSNQIEVASMVFSTVF